jgi:hypothetical protein
LINTKIPTDFCPESIELLNLISKYEHDEVLDLVVVVQFLKRKWMEFGYKFFLFQFVSFSILLTCLTINEIFESNIKIITLILGFFLHLIPMNISLVGGFVAV